LHDFFGEPGRRVLNGGAKCTATGGEGTRLQRRKERQAIETQILAGGRLGSPVWASRRGQIRASSCGRLGDFQRFRLCVSFGNVHCRGGLDGTPRPSLPGDHASTGCKTFLGLLNGLTGFVDAEINQVLNLV